MGSILEITKLRVTRGTTTILQNVNWRVGAREHWVMLGPNGCGKTSLLKALTGYLTTTEGDIALLGHRFGETDWRELRLQIGIVTSALQAGIPPAEPAIETVISGRYAQLDLWQKTTRADAIDARKWLRFFNAVHLENRAWVYLSQGERQRVLIARALMSAPKLLILDEPCAGLDPIARKEFLGFVEILAKRRGGPALVLVTHHIEEITPSFTHALLLRDGTSLASGPREKILTSAQLSDAFSSPVKVRKNADRTLRLEVS